MRSRIFALFALCGLLFTAIPSLSVLNLSPVVAHADSGHDDNVRSARVQGYLVAVPVTSTLPLTVQVQTPNVGLVNVLVTANTKIAFRYGGTASLDALNANDVLLVVGPRLVGGTLTASSIEDLSQQQGDTYFEGIVTGAGANTVTTVVQRTWGRYNPLMYGQSVLLPIGANTVIVSGTLIVTGTVGMSLFSPNERVYANGIYSRANNGFTSVSHVRILPALPPHLYRETLRGFIASAPISTSAGMMFSVQTLARGVYTITDDAQTVVTRRYGGHTTSAALMQNDVVDVVAMVPALTMTSVTASAVRDWSIQSRYTGLVGRVLAVGPTSISVIVQNTDHYAPFDIGQNMVLPVSATTQVVSGTTTLTGSLALPTPIQLGQRVYAYGVFNRVSQMFESATFLKVLP